MSYVELVDMYHPTLDAHYLAQPSQVRVLKKSGWWVYSEWLAAQSAAPAPAPAPAPDPTPAPAPDPTPAPTADPTPVSYTTASPTL